MQRFVPIKTPEDLGRFEGLGGSPPAEMFRHGPDAHWLLLNGDGQPVGRCSLWWRNTPAHQDHRVGLIGHYWSGNSAAGPLMLRHACGQLADKGCTLAVGPMDGNTWRRYRLITERGSEPPFLMEPDHPDDWPAHFVESGFEPLAHYFSALNDTLQGEDPRIRQARDRFASAGVRIRPLDPAHFEEELEKIYAVSEVSFQNNFLYTPTTREEFIAQYRSIQNHVRPELVLLAEHDGRTIGFSFTVPDLLQARRGETIDTVIVKTVAVLPGRAHAGLGTYLVAHSQVVAQELGYKRAIHALMHETNTSRNISRHYARPIRRYTLFAKPLRP